MTNWVVGKVGYGEWFISFLRCGHLADTLGAIRQYCCEEANRSMGANIPVSLLLFIYEQLSYILEICDVVKTVLTVAIWALASKCRVFLSADIRFRLTSTFTTKDLPPKEPPKVFDSVGDVIPPWTSYNLTQWRIQKFGIVGRKDRGCGEGAMPFSKKFLKILSKKWCILVQNFSLF